jgi:hypothetical protein
MGIAFVPTSLWKEGPGEICLEWFGETHAIQPKTTKDFSLSLCETNG